MIASGRVRAAAVTGIGAVSALGSDCASLWRGIVEGRTAIAPIRRFSTDGFSVTLGAEAIQPDSSWHSAAEGSDAAVLGMELARRALLEAMHDSGALHHVTGERVALVLGSGLIVPERGLHQLTAELADYCGLRGPRLSVSTACSSSTGAIGLALDLLALNAADIVIAGGADVLTQEVFAGFHALGVLTPARCAPFSTPAGTTLGEGAGFLVLERRESAVARGAQPRGFVAGYGLSCDAFHETSPEPGGSGVSRALRAAMDDAGIGDDAIDYVNAHGSGTEANDAAEWLGIQRVVGPRPVALPVSSTKGAIGHAQGAAGVLEAIVTLEGMRHGCIPQTLNFAGPRPHAPPDPVAGPRPRPGPIDFAVSLNSAFGGANAAIVLSHRAPPDRPRPQRAVYLRGAGRFSMLGADRTEAAWLCDGIPASELRRCDPSTLALTAAIAQSLRDAQRHINGKSRERTGLFVGQLRASPASLAEFHQSIEARGLQHLSAAAFSRIVTNAAAGACARLLELRGPHTVVSTGGSSGLAACVLAAEYLAGRPDVDRMLVGAVDEEDSDSALDAANPAVDAVSVVLEGAAERGTDAVAVMGWGMAAPGELGAAIARAAPGGVPPNALHLSFGTRAAPNGEAHACPSLHSVADALMALRGGRARTALITADCSEMASLALLLAT